MKIVIFTTGSRGFEVARYLIKKGYKIHIIFVPKGTNIDTAKENIKCDTTQVIPIDDPNNSSVLKLLKNINLDVIITAGYNKLLKKELLLQPSIGSLNLHAGRLPQYRGGSPMNWQIINGENTAGISVIKLTEKLDDGPILAEVELPIQDYDTIVSMHAKANAVFPEITLQALTRLQDNSIIRNQSEKLARYWHQRCDRDGLIDWSSMSAIEVVNLIRALTKPYNGAFTFLGNTKLRILSASINKFAFYGTPGRVGFIAGLGPLVICKSGSVLLQSYEDDLGREVKLKNGNYLGPNFI
jgi:methionyl-tRNA formyltransferase